MFDISLAKQYCSSCVKKGVVSILASTIPCTDRALPHLGDGLKPVQRRIIYARSEHGTIYELEGGNIVITALPYQSSGERILEQIAGQMNAKKLLMIEDLRDELCGRGLVQERFIRHAGQRTTDKCLLGKFQR